jgi:general stress protein YciG
MTEGRQRRGFASMDAERRSDIARLGGRSVPSEKRSFAQNHGLAAAAGRTGGQNVPGEKRSFAQNRELAAEAGRKGGISRRQRRTESLQDSRDGANAGGHHPPPGGSGSENVP